MMNGQKNIKLFPGFLVLAFIVNDNCVFLARTHLHALFIS